MSALLPPRMHGLTHAPGGPDPIPGLGGGGDGIQFETMNVGGWLNIKTTNALTDGIDLISAQDVHVVADCDAALTAGDGDLGGDLYLTVHDGTDGHGNFFLNADRGIRLEAGENIVLNADLSVNVVGKQNLNLWASGTNANLNLDAGGDIRMGSLPTSDPGVPGALWNSGGDLVISGYTPGGGGGAPTGPAGGVLAGTYPNPGFAQDMATQTELDTGLNTKVSRDAVEAASARLVATKLAAGDTVPAFKISGDGSQAWGPGGTGSLDVVLYRAGAGHLSTDGSELTAQGKIRAGRGAANQITLDTNGRIYLGNDSATWIARAGGQYTGVQGLFVDLADAGLRLYFGSAADTSIYRAGAGQLGLGLSLGTRTLEWGAADSGGAGYRMLRIAN